MYSPLLESIFLHDRKNGQWGEQLGKVAVPEIGPKIQLMAAACGEFAALILTDGSNTYHTAAVKISNVKSGPAGVWLYQIGERQQFDNFEVSQTRFAPVPREAKNGATHLIQPGKDHAPRVPSPQDWVLVMERVDLERSP